MASLELVKVVGSYSINDPAQHLLMAHPPEAPAFRQIITKAEAMIKEAQLRREALDIKRKFRFWRRHGHNAQVFATTIKDFMTTFRNVVAFLAQADSPIRQRHLCGCLCAPRCRKEEAGRRRHHLAVNQNVRHLDEAIVENISLLP